MGMGHDPRTRRRIGIVTLRLWKTANSTAAALGNGQGVNAVDSNCGAASATFVCLRDRPSKSAPSSIAKERLLMSP